MRRIEDIIEQLITYHPEADREMVERAYIFSASAHAGQVRQSGEPYLSHPLEVAGLLTDMKLDTQSVTSGLLHDTIEDSAATLDTVVELFGDEVGRIVDGVTKISKMQFSSNAERQAENMRKMILAMSTDIRVILVKLADRIHNMRTLGYMPTEKQGRIAQETIDIYAPLAARLGIHKFQSELEDLCLYYLEPEIYQDIRSGITSKRGERERYIREVIEILTTKMSDFNIPCEISGRPKHMYSIYKKMQKQNLSIDQVYDITAFRIVVDSVKDCYAALGVIHSVFKPIPGRFKDYISLSKANGYQSLHTAVIGTHAERMEVQIRTREMHSYAENGIAAHWRYKEGDRLSESENQRFVWLRSLIEWQKDLKDDPDQFLSNVREGLFTEDAYVYVFTPAGDVRELPRGATPVDFAYSIHTQVGHSCTGAKVNGSIAPLKYQLNDGDTVDIIRSKNGTPSKDWLGFVVTTKAKHRIRQWFKSLEKERAVSLGKEMLEKEFRKEDTSFNQVLKDGTLERIAKDWSLVGIEDLYASVGFGKIRTGQVIGKLKPKEEPEASFVDRVLRRTKKTAKQGIKVRGIDDILVRFPGCCNPLPGEEIVGYITQGKGVTVHSAKCKALTGIDPMRQIDVEWDLDGAVTYPVRIQVTFQDRPGGLAELSRIISDANANIVKAAVETTPEGKGTLDGTIQVSNKDHLRRVMQNIRKLKWVERVTRIET